ncbi:type III pantothenate kinase [Treponema sp. R6D11]
MNACIDIGNSYIKVGIFDGDELLKVEKFATKPLTFLECENLLSNFEYDNLFIASVVPHLTDVFVQASKIKPQVLTVNTSPLPILYPSIGSDVLAYASYIAEHYPLPATVFSLGTATVCTHINIGKEIGGGLIMPGIYSGLDGLVEKTNQLPEIVPEHPIGFFARSTKDAINNGVFYQTISTIDWVTKKNDARTNIVCGGGVNLVRDYLEKELDDEFICDEFLVLRGLNMIFGNTEKSRAGTS